METGHAKSKVIIIYLNLNQLKSNSFFFNIREPLLRHCWIEEVDRRFPVRDDGRHAEIHIYYEERRSASQFQDAGRSYVSISLNLFTIY